MEIAGAVRDSDAILVYPPKLRWKVGYLQKELRRERDIAEYQPEEADFRDPGPAGGLPRAGPPPAGGNTLTSSSRTVTSV